MKESNKLFQELYIRYSSEINLAVQLASGYYNIDPEVMFIRSRKREICFSRQIAMILIKKTTRLSLSAIGSYFGEYDHATVLNAAKTVNNEISTNVVFRNWYLSVLEELNLKKRTFKHEMLNVILDKLLETGNKDQASRDIFNMFLFPTLHTNVELKREKIKIVKT